MPDLFKNFPEIIQKAAESPLGIAALVILVVSVIAISFFRKASEKTRTVIFICIIIGFLIFGLAIFFIRSDRSSVPPVPPVPPPVIANFDKCLGSPPKDTIVYLEEGSHDEDLIEVDKLNNRTLNIIFTDNRKPIGAMKVNFHLQNNMFKIQSIFNDICQPIKEFKNTTHGAPHYVIQDWDVIEMQFGNKKYAIRLGYQAGTISVNYFKKIF